MEYISAAGSLLYHDLDNNRLFYRSKYGSVWNPPPDAYPWEQLATTDKYIIQTLTYSITVEADAYADNQVPYSMPAGYKLLSANAYYNSGNDVFVVIKYVGSKEM